MWASHQIRENLPVGALHTPGRSNGDKTGPIGGLPACGKLWTMLASPPTQGPVQRQRLQKVHLFPALNRANRRPGHLS